MKIITITHAIKAGDLLNHLQQNLNTLFRKRRQSSITFNIEARDSDIIIFNKQLYEDILYTIKIMDREIDIIPSEHYTDDINSITLLYILNNLIIEYLGGMNIEFIHDHS